MKILDPRVGPEADLLTLAPPLPSLAGRTVGLLDNGKINVSSFLDQIEAILRSDYGVSAFVRRRKPNVSRPVPPPLLAELSECDAIISAVGD